MSLLHQQACQVHELSETNKRFFSSLEEIIVTLGEDVMMKRCLLTTNELLPSLLELVCTKSIPLHLRKITLETINRYDVEKYTAFISD